MHPALLLEEILYIIFGHCYPQHHFWPRSEQGCSAADLVALARTCRVFKEPALDILWTELSDPTPLARCLPEVCCLKSSELGHLTYMFKRRVKESERDAVKKYTRRVRALTLMCMDARSLDRESLADLCRPSMTEPFFPNIRRLYFYITDQTVPLVHHIAVPELRWLHLHFAVSNISSCENFVHSLGSSCPNVKTIRITSFCGRLLIGFDEIIIRHIRRWTHLQAVDCPEVSLDIDTLFHLSHMPRLTELSFTLSPALTDQIASFDQVLVFSALQRLQITIGLIVPISKLFTHMRLPDVTSIGIFFLDTSPPTHIIATFLMALQNACTCKFAWNLSIYHAMFPALVVQNSGHTVLTLKDIHYFTALNLTGININLDWVVDLKDSDLLELASQRLTSLLINDVFGWRTTDGITPAGLARFLQRCPSLQQFCIVIDTRGYTLPPQIQTSGGNPMPCLSSVNVADSVIEAESVPVLAAFFADFFPLLGHGNRFFVRSWGCFGVRRHHQDWEVHMKRWEEVYELAKQKLLERSQGSAAVVENC